MNVLQRLPPWATTGVGSLPCADGARAAAHAVKAYDVPFVPQLPLLDGDMVEEWRGDRAEPRAWAPLLDELARRPPTHGVVKLQATGPLTLARARDDGTSAVAIAAGQAARVAEQVDALASLGLDAVLVLDEPGLAALAAGDDDAAARAWDPLRAVAPAWGLHVCGPVPWDVVEAAAPDLMSFDLRLGIDADAVARLAARGTRIAWGVLAPDAPESDAEAAALLAAALTRTGVSGDQSLLTPSCGTGPTTPDRENAVSAGLAALAAGLSSRSAA